MKYRYLIIDCACEEVTGTNSLEIAMRHFMVIDTLHGKYLDTRSTDQIASDIAWQHPTSFEIAEQKE